MLKNPKGSLFPLVPFPRIFGTMRLSGNFKKIRKKSEFFSQFLVLKDRSLKTDLFVYVTFQNLICDKAEKSLTKPKSLIVPKKVKTFCFGILVKKLAHTHGFEHETSGLKSKHLTTRPRTRETCELPREIRELSRGKKAPALSHNTCLSQV